jgi:hypothetical protein
MRKPARINPITWTHVSKGFYRRADGKGVVNHVGPNDWSAMTTLPGGPARVGNGHTAFQACSFVDRAVPPCPNCLGSGRHCGYHGMGDVCSCAADCPDCRQG